MIISFLGNLMTTKINDHIVGGLLIRHRGWRFCQVINSYGKILVQKMNILDGTGEVQELFLK